MLSGLRKVSGRALAAAGVVALSAGVLGIAATPAGATSHTFSQVSCAAHVTGDLTLDTTVKNDFTLEVTSPTEANSGSDFLITIPAGDTPLPNSSAGPPPVDIQNYTNLSNVYVVTGGNVVPGSIVVTGVPKNNGNVVTGNIAFNGNSLVSSTPGPVLPGTLSTPKVTFKVHAGAVGSTVSVKPGNVTLTTSLIVHGTALHLSAAVTCDLSSQPNNVLTTTQIVAPPPPGAPNAVADVATTPAGKAVTINVLKNDTANSAAPINKDSLAITIPPKHGTAKVNLDHTVTYTPNAGFSGQDVFTYKLCSQMAPPETTTTQEQIDSVVHTAAAVLPCDTAKVTVTVVAPTPVTVATTVAPATTVAAAAELPRTGSSSTPLAIIGFGLVVGGLAATGFAKSRGRSTAN